MVFFSDTWTEDIELGNLRVLLESFHIVVPHFSRESFVKTLLDETLLKECVYKVRSLARRVVLCKNFDEKNKKQNPGTVMVYEVIVMNEDNEVFIYEKVIIKQKWCTIITWCKIDFKINLKFFFLSFIYLKVNFVLILYCRIPNIGLLFLRRNGKKTLLK